MRELDLLLQHFLDRHYCALAIDEQRDFVRLLEYPDQLLFEYLLGRMVPSDPIMAALVSKVRVTFVDEGGGDT